MNARENGAVHWVDMQTRQKHARVRGGSAELVEHAGDGLVHDQEVPASTAAHVLVVGVVAKLLIRKLESVHGHPSDR